MFYRQRAQSFQSRPSAGRSAASLRLAAMTALLVGSLVATAFAASSALTLGSASNAALSERVAINAQGRTLYVLSPETTRHLLCKSSECLRRWIPLSVSSSKTKLKDGAGVQGHLALLRRGNGALQVTLRGLPLYRYTGDHAKGQASGEGVKSFGGTWHAMGATSSAGATKPSAPSTPSMPSEPSMPSTPAMPAPAPPNPYPAY